MEGVLYEFSGPIRTLNEEFIMVESNKTAADTYSLAIFRAIRRLQQAAVSAETLGVDFSGLLEAADGAENSERIGIGSGLITFNHNKFFVKGPDRPGKFV